MIRYRVPTTTAQANQPHEIRILHIVDLVSHQKTYFQPVTQELREHLVPDGYLDYLSRKLRGVMDQCRPGESPRIYVQMSADMYARPRREAQPAHDVAKCRILHRRRDMPNARHRGATKAVFSVVNAV